jgi:primosomal protein N' (replication factor Y)
VLTTQLVNRLASRFTSIAVMHSGLTGAQRSVMWRQIASGSRSVIVGTRSAVFAPCPNLGILIVDEEQEGSFKNLQAPRFHVRDVAIMRAKNLNIPVVLGSATPSLETWHRSERHPDYRRVILSERVNRMPMPKVHIVDMEAELAETRSQSILSRLMERMLDETLTRGEQALLLMNRRGFANRIICPACHTRLTCPNCNVNLVVHTASGFTICHYCRMRVPIPEFCPNVTCRERLVQMGSGTQRIEKVLADRFPAARVRRVDSDSMKSRADYENLVHDFEARKIDVLVGTQMIAKGLDFPFVSFVGVVDADLGAFSADFRAGERLFQLITQVAGRAGRAETGGRVVVQTTLPDLPVLRFALQHDYDAFAGEELRTRARCGWPPFRRLARIVVAHAREETAMNEAAVVASNASTVIGQLALDSADVLGPTPCVLSRIRGKYRYEVLIRAAHAKALRELLAGLEEGGMRSKALLTIDVDPVDLA